MKRLKEYDYEGEMAKSTLKKLIVFSNELLPLIEDNQQLPAWLQDKFSKLDYYINAVYSYIKFSNIENPESEDQAEEEPAPEGTSEDDTEDLAEGEMEDSMELDETTASNQTEMELEIKLDGIVKK